MVDIMTGEEQLTLELEQAPVGTFLITQRKDGVFRKYSEDKWYDLDPTTTVKEWEARGIAFWMTGSEFIHWMA